jgi:predicted RNase H-like nuclease
VVVVLAGLDGTKAGWIAALRDGPSGKVRIEAVDAFLPWARQLPRDSVVGIDIPMGLEAKTLPGGRSCERATRALLGRGKSSSIFSTPSRRAVYAETWEEACRIVQSELPERQGISRQAWNIFAKVREIDVARSKRLPIDLREAHPEVAFLTLNGGKAVLASKKSEAGRLARIGLLKKAGLFVTPFLQQRPPGCAVDDLIDSFACLWVAGRIYSGDAVGYGDAPLTQIWA